MHPAIHVHCVQCASVVAAVVLVSASPLSAQAIRGTVTEDSTRRPVGEALVTLLDEAGHPVGSIATRTDSTGRFALYAHDQGTYRVGVTRVGYLPATSPPVKVQKVDITTLNVPLTTVATRVTPITVVERRALTSVELDGRTGFDYRRARGFGHYMTDSDLVGMTRLDDIAGTGKAGYMTVPSGPEKEFAIGGNSHSGGRLVCDSANHNVTFVLDGHPVFSWAELDGRVQMPSVAAVEVYLKGQLPPSAIGIAASSVGNQESGQLMGRGRAGPPIGFAQSCIVMVWTKSYFQQMDSTAAHEAEKHALKSAQGVAERKSK